MRWKERNKRLSSRADRLICYICVVYKKNTRGMARRNAPPTTGSYLHRAAVFSIKAAGWMSLVQARQRYHERVRSTSIYNILVNYKAVGPSR